jgi:NAD(P)-dependent dehydrogenase (short-subunit alcohol dehydrogenase family)
MNESADHPWKQFDLTDRVAIVTGGAGLLGRQFCRTLAQAGARVILGDLELDQARLIAESLQSDGFAVSAHLVDVTSPVSSADIVASTISQHGQVDILVNSAAMDPKFDPDHHEASSNAFEDYPLDMWEAALRVNLTGMFLMSQATARAMKEQEKGVIINICSTYGLVGPDQRIYQRKGEPTQFKPAYYSTTKAGVLGFTRYLAAYYAGGGIRVNALTPGGVYNEHADEFVQAYSARTILGRMAHSDEMNGALLFLASDASSYMTGSNLIVDGGWTAW